MTAVKRGGLGRGLGALLGDERRAASGLDAIAVGSIRPNPRQPRKTFEPEALDELRRSIEGLGVLVPIIVRPLAARDGAALYEIVAGERRWRASAAAGLATVPAIVRDVDDRTSLEFAVVENLQRADLDPLEEAMGLQHLLDEYGYTHEALAERIGKSRPAVANALRLLALPDAVKAQLRASTLSAGHARALLGLASGEAVRLGERAGRDGLSVRDVERIARDLKSPEARAKRPKRRAVSADLAAVEGRLRYALGARVEIVAGRRGGRLEIRYADAADLTRLVDLLLPEEA